MAGIAIVDFSNKRVVKRVDPGEAGKKYLRRWSGLIERVGAGNVEPIEYPQETRTVKIPYCGMLDRAF